MEKLISIFVFMFICFCMSINSGYSQTAPIPMQPQVITADVNKDGKPDVFYYSDDGEYITKAEADTNYDGKSDVVVHTKDGKFESAEVDTDYNGTTDKKFDNAVEFNKWLNENNPDFNDSLNRADWRATMFKF